MKAKTIKKVIQAKLKDWLESIDDPALQTQIRHNVVVTGGCIASMLLKERVNDFDIYFRDRATTIAVAEYYVRKFKANPPSSFKNHPTTLDIVVVKEDDRVGIKVRSAGIAGAPQEDYQYFESVENQDAAGNYVEAAMNVMDADADDEDKYRPVFMSTNAITLSHDVQIITRFFGTPDELHANFDFVHTMNYFDSKSGELVLNAKALEALLSRELIYIGSRYPLCSVIRTRKFINRGFTINAGQYLKMLFQVSQLDLTDLKTLEDQLTGVDAAYFMEVIGKLRERGDSNIDAAYLIEVIDRIF
jgi:hypothetical protein